MPDRSLICPAWEVQAWLAGRKAEFRRPVNPQPHKQTVCYTRCPRHKTRGDIWAPSCECCGMNFDLSAKCPFGAAGDTLLVKETWCSPSQYIVGYAADSECGAWFGDGKGGRVWVHHGYILEAPGYNQAVRNPSRKAINTIGLRKYGDCWRSPATMPRWAVGLRLELTAVRVQTVQDITEEEARAEGVLLTDETEDPEDAGTYREPFAFKWDEAYAKRGLAFEDNPWVWVGEARRIDA